jgi:hypothetical protein
MAVEPEEEEKQAHGRQQPNFPVRAKTRRKFITSDGTSRLRCLSNLADYKPVQWMLRPAVAPQK